MSTPSAGGRLAAPPLSAMSACLTVRWPMTCHARLSERTMGLSRTSVFMGRDNLKMETAHAGHSLPHVGVCSSLRKEMDLRAGLAPASAVYDTAASLPMLAESEWLPGHDSHMHSRFQRPPSYSLDDPAMAEG